MTRSLYAARTVARSESRDSRLQALGFRDYDDYLGSAAWHRVKAHYRKLVIESCELCGGEDSLDLHHRTYERVGEEIPSDLAWLCRKCHTMVHVLERRGEMGLDFQGLSDEERAVKYAIDDSARRERINALPGHSAHVKDRLRREVYGLERSVRNRRAAGRPPGFTEKRLAEKRRELRALDPAA